MFDERRPTTTPPPHLSSRHKKNARKKMPILLRASLYLLLAATPSNLQRSSRSPATLFLASALSVQPQWTSNEGRASYEAASSLLALLNGEDGTSDGSGPWGDRSDLMGLLVRLPFHDAATYNVTEDGKSSGGSDGCVDLASPENKGLQEAIDLLEPIRLDAWYLEYDGEGNLQNKTLSRADVWALAGNVMIEEAGGPRLEYKLGRTDAPLEGGCDGQGSRHIGSESTSSTEVEEAFVRRLNFTHREVVALIGAHVLGRANLNNSGYDGPWVKRNDEFTNAYFVDLLHKPWIKQKEDVEPFGERTTWRRFADGRMFFEEEIMLQTDVDLAFQTTGGYFCSRVGGTFNRETSCPNATHPFADNVREFARDEEAWREVFAKAWAKLTSMTDDVLRCGNEDCLTPDRSGETVSARSSASCLWASFREGIELGAVVASLLSALAWFVGI